MDTSLVIFFGLLTWRVTAMLFKERGPLDVFTRLRAYAAQKQTHMGGIYDMMSCFKCLSIWVAMLPAILLADNLLTFIIYTLILSAEAIFFARVFDKLK